MRRRPTTAWNAATGSTGSGKAARPLAACWNSPRWLRPLLLAAAVALVYFPF